MTGFVEEKPRDVIPRWRTFEETTSLGELGSGLPSQPHRVEYRNSLAQQKVDWKKHQTIGHASDLVGSALFHKEPHEAREAAEFLLRNESKISRWVKELAERCMSTPNKNQDTCPHPTVPGQSFSQGQIKKLRRLLREESKNPIGWVDLSHAFACLGLHEKASQSMTTALQLAPNNRFTLRSASRLWVHLNEIDKAHDILARSDRTPHDPWLMSAEIAVANTRGIRPKFVKEARNLLADKTLSQFHLSELASAVATIEWSHGHNKNSKRFFLLSLMEPTENSIAQAFWVSSKDNFINLNEDHWLHPNVFEAKARDFYLREKWEQAIEQCKLWQRDQPFSSAPGIRGSFIASVILEDFEEAKNIAKTGLTANPKNFLLLNNAAVALINLGEFDEAKKMLSRISPSENDNIQYKVVRMATSGLLQYRTGNIEEGRKLYFDARSLAESQSEYGPILAARAAAFHAIEEFSHQGPNYHQMIDEALQTLKKHDDPACKILADKLTALKSDI